MAQILGSNLSAVGRNCKYLFAGVVQGPISGSLNLGRAPCQVTRVATLVATHGETLPNYDPWPYKEKKYTTIHEFLDNTSKRINENSKVIIVEGNIGVGKNEFAKRLANNFGMKYFNPVEEAECFGATIIKGSFDMRELNELLPPNAQCYDLKQFYSESNPKRGTIGRFQLSMYKKRVYVYQEALLHLLSTGQGVVIPRSVFGDNAFVEAGRKLEYLSPQFKKYYYELRNNTICELLKPHITIFLDAPVNVLRERITKRADPREAGSSVLSDKYIEAIHDSYRKMILPALRKSGEVVEVNWEEVGDDLDMDVIVEDLCTLELKPEDNEDTRFEEWKLSEDKMCHYRKIYGSTQLVRLCEFFEPPYHCPEIHIDGDDLLALYSLQTNHPGINYRPSWAPELQSSKLAPYLRLW